MGKAKPFDIQSWKRPNIGSRMNREVHVRFWERPEVRLLWATRRIPLCRQELDGRAPRHRPRRGRTAGSGQPLHRHQSAGSAEITLREAPLRQRAGRKSDQGAQAAPRLRPHLVHQSHREPVPAVDPHRGLLADAEPARSGSEDLLLSCVRQVQQIGHVERALVGFQGNSSNPLVRSEMTIPSSRPASWQSAARSGSQGCRREGGGTGGAGAQRP